MSSNFSNENLDLEHIEQMGKKFKELAQYLLNNLKDDDIYLKMAAYNKMFTMIKMHDIFHQYRQLEINMAKIIETVNPERFERFFPTSQDCGHPIFKSPDNDNLE